MVSADRRLRGPTGTKPFDSGANWFDDSEPACATFWDSLIDFEAEHELERRSFVSGSAFPVADYEDVDPEIERLAEMRIELLMRKARHEEVHENTERLRLATIRLRELLAESRAEYVEGLSDVNKEIAGSRARTAQLRSRIPGV